MKVVYVTLTGNVQRFVNKLEERMPQHEYIKAVRQMKVDEPFILITYTINFGNMPVHVKELIESSSDNIVAVIGSGNRNWGNHFCGGAKKVSEQCNVPLLHAFELSGLSSDVEIVVGKIKVIEEGMNQVVKMD